MATQTTMTENTDTTKTTRPRPEGPRSFGIRMRSGDETLHLRGYKKKDGWRSEARHKAGKVTKRGATADHPTIEAARKAVEALAATAERAGWVRKAARSFARMPDAFSAANLPTPAKSAKKR